MNVLLLKFGYKIKHPYVHITYNNTPWLLCYQQMS